MKRKNLTCIVCPRGCQMTAILDENGVFLSVEGNACPRGKVYAEAECTHPERTVTSTVRCEDGSLVSVKTNRPVPKEKMLDVMKEINSVRAKTKIKIGEIVIEGVAGTSADVVATSNWGAG